MSCDDHLFVYGTLRRNFTNQFAALLQSVGQWLGQGRVQGRLYAIGEYPGLVTSDGSGEWVQGDVYCLPAPGELYSLLDPYEGCGPDDPQPHEFDRVVLPVLLHSGEWISACAYVYKQDVRNRQKIPSGDFLVHLNAEKRME
jgi:gamma-glutamylcyclotransferase (GGCT)/AIG2-like uncharacterized protein YtfP